jgi:hypothetical protein
MTRINPEYPPVFPTIGTTLGYSSARHVTSLAEFKNIRIQGTEAARILEMFDTNTPLEYSNGDGKGKKVRSLGFVMLGNRGEETIYLGVSAGGNKVDEEIPITSQRSDRKVSISKRDSSWEITDDNGHGLIHYTVKKSQL